MVIRVVEPVTKKTLQSQYACLLFFVISLITGIIVTVTDGSGLLQQRSSSHLNPLGQLPEMHSPMAGRPLLQVYLKQAGSSSFD